MSKKSNKANNKTNSFLLSLEKETLEHKNNKLTEKCKFNFAYLSKQENSQLFSDLTENELRDLTDKIKEYSKESLVHWQNREIGTGKKRGKVFAIYGSFPLSNMSHPDNVPLDVKWARFRLNYTFRLAGFIIPDELNNKIHSKTYYSFDKNTFYVVFIDRDHKFYISQNQ